MEDCRSDTDEVRSTISRSSTPSNHSLETASTASGVNRKLSFGISAILGHLDDEQNDTSGERTSSEGTVSGPPTPPSGCHPSSLPGFAPSLFPLNRSRDTFKPYAMHNALPVLPKVEVDYNGLQHLHSHSSHGILGYNLPAPRSFTIGGAMSPNHGVLGNYTPTLDNANHDVNASIAVQRRVGHPYQNRTPPKRKKPRTSFTRIQIMELEKRFHGQKYLASAERSSLAKSLKMSDSQVKTWFQNRRTKWRRQTAEEREAERQAAKRFMAGITNDSNTLYETTVNRDPVCLNNSSLNAMQSITPWSEDRMNFSNVQIPNHQTAMV
ncbi:unnamed protein product [Owenia fusiformis]|uniref:Uncharacterized protein n=1 Tax=Owenia fusiformis TaxID=6347 RepID=A0A8J1XEH4_OWEFU|nr:unnamed protein product [Owenia fusiformis]